MFGSDWDILLEYLQCHPSSGAIPVEEFSYHVRVGMGLGEAVATHTLRRFGELSPEEILELEGVVVLPMDAPIGTGVQILAEFRPTPPQVKVFPNRIGAIRGRLPDELRDYFSPRLMDISLAHELYHYLWETQYKDTDWISLIRSLGFSPLIFENLPAKRVFRSPLTQEFAALQFSKNLLGLTQSPALLCLSPE